MITAADDPLAVRRERLIARSGELRSELQRDAKDIAGRLWLIDRTTAYLQSPSGRVVIGGGVLLVLLMGPRRWARIARRFLIVWPAVRPLVWPLLIRGTDRSAKQESAPTTAT